MRYGSVCSGIEAATTAWHPLGWQPAWFSEIEPFPSAVLAHHYPTVPNYGDMTKFEEWPNEPIDLLVGGTPCQSFSVAGLRRGLADPRGNLMLTYLAIAQRHRPQWLVWENVPGVLSSNGGRDFGTFLGALGQLGYGFAYRVLDAQWFGVAQRRRRVFVVGYLGDWQRAAKVLFESESVCRNPAPSREKGQDAAKCLTAGVGKRYDFETETLPVAFHNRQDPSVSGEITYALGAKDNGMGIAQPVPYDFYQITAPVNRQSRKPGDPCHTLARDNAAHATIMQPTYGIPGNWIGRQPENGGNAVEPMRDVSPCLTKTDRHGVAQPVYGIDAEQNCSEELIGTLRSHQSGGYEGARVAQPITQFGDIAGSLTARHDSSPCADRGQNVVAQPTASAETAGTLRANAGSGFRSNGTPVEGVAIQAMQVRRLTPVECERLQGFPDNYTNIPWRKKPESPDGPRYKALGNSMAVPVMRWIGQRIAEVDAE